MAFALNLNIAISAAARLAAAARRAARLKKGRLEHRFM